MERAVSNRIKCASIERAPRALLAISAPIGANTTATTESATSASISVNPQTPLSAVDCDNLDSSGQPIHAHLIAHPQTTKRNDSATGHPRRKKTNCESLSVRPAARGQKRIECDILW